MAENQQALGAEIMKEVKRYNDGMGCTRRQLVDNVLILISQSRLSPASAAPVVDKDATDTINKLIDRWVIKHHILPQHVLVRDVRALKEGIKNILEPRFVLHWPFAAKHPNCAACNREYEAPPAAATAAPVKQESQYVVIDGKRRRVIPCPDGKPDCEVLHTEPVSNEGAR